MPRVGTSLRLHKWPNTGGVQRHEGRPSMRRGAAAPPELEGICYAQKGGQFREMQSDTRDA
jgi:hypothetical protein